MASDKELAHIIAETTDLIKKFNPSTAQITKLILAIYNTQPRTHRPG